MKPEQERVRHLLTDTVSLLCKNGLQFQDELKVEGLIGITVDNSEVFIVHINEAFGPGGVQKSPPKTLGSGPVHATVLSDLPGMTVGNRGRIVPRGTMRNARTFRGRPYTSAVRRGSAALQRRLPLKQQMSRSRGTVNTVQDKGAVMAPDPSDTYVHSLPSSPPHIVKTETDEDAMVVVQGNIPSSSTVSVPSTDSPTKNQDLPQSITSKEYGNLGLDDIAHGSIPFFDPMNDSVDSQTCEPNAKQDSESLETDSSALSPLISSNSAAITTSTSLSQPQSSSNWTTSTSTESSLQVKQETPEDVQALPPSLQPMGNTLSWPMDVDAHKNKSHNYPGASSVGDTACSGSNDNYSNNIVHIKGGHRVQENSRASLHDAIEMIGGGEEGQQEWLPNLMTGGALQQPGGRRESSAQDMPPHIVHIDTDAADSCLTWAPHPTPNMTGSAQRNPPLSSAAAAHTSMTSPLHAGVQFQCSFCDKIFTRRDNFKGHMNTHVGAKPYQCDACLKCFAYSNNLTRHKKNCKGHV